MSEDYVSICNLCKNPVSKADLEYINGTSYHINCLKKADEIIKPDQNTLDKINMIRLDIIKIRNLLARGSNISKRIQKPARRTVSKARTTRKVKSRKPARRTVSKARTTRKVKSRKPARRTVSKARTTRKVKSRKPARRTVSKARTTRKVKSRKPARRTVSKARTTRKVKSRKPARRTVSKARTTRKVKSRKPARRTVSKARTTRRKSQTSIQRTDRKTSLQSKKLISFKVRKKVI